MARQIAGQVPPARSAKHAQFSRRAARGIADSAIPGFGQIAESAYFLPSKLPPYFSFCLLPSAFCLNMISMPKLFICACLAVAAGVIRLPLPITPGPAWTGRVPRDSGRRDVRRLPHRHFLERDWKRKECVWSTAVAGLGHSSPVIWGDRLCVTTAISGRADAGLKPGLYGNIESVNDDTSHTWKLLCYDKKTGKHAGRHDDPLGRAQGQTPHEVHARQLHARHGRHAPHRDARLRRSATHST